MTRASKTRALGFFFEPHGVFRQRQALVFFEVREATQTGEVNTKLP